MSGSQKSDSKKHPARRSFEAVKSEKVRYRRGRYSIQVTVRWHRIRKCAFCGRSPPEVRVVFHHWCYEYTLEEVKADPKLAVENGVELCDRHAWVADGMRLLLDLKDKREKIALWKFLKPIIDSYISKDELEISKQKVLI